MIEGDMDAGAWSCGMVVGLIHDIPNVADLISRIMAEAERLIRNSLAGLLDDNEIPVTKVA
jgi:NADH:quinone reductase (non-electrogenic)